MSDTEKKHLILTGKNGSGKTSVLNAIKSYLKAIEEGLYINLPNIDKNIQLYKERLENTNELDSLSQFERSKYIEQGCLILAEP